MPRQREARRPIERRSPPEAAVARATARPTAGGCPSHRGIVGPERAQAQVLAAQSQLLAAQSQLLAAQSQLLAAQSQLLAAQSRLQAEGQADPLPGDGNATR